MIDELPEMIGWMKEREGLFHRLQLFSCYRICQFGLAVNMPLATRNESMSSDHDDYRFGLGAPCLPAAKQNEVHLQHDMRCNECTF